MLADRQGLIRLGSFLLLGLAEVLYLSIRFDTASLEDAPGLLAQLIGWAPQFLRIAVAAVAVGIVVNAIRPKRPGGIPRTVTKHQRYYLAAHLCAFFFLFRLSATVIEDYASLRNPLTWTLVWILLGTLTLLSWALSLYGSTSWLRILKNERLSIVGGMVGGPALWASGFLTQELWKPLSTATFQVVSWMLNSIYAETVSSPHDMVLGTRAFTVRISPECSGYEGIGLVLVFLGIYLYLQRKTLIFPSALLLLPAGALAIWILNAVRITGLVAIGTAGWEEIAEGGFHSQAGWLSFNGVSLGIVALTVRRGYFANPEAFDTAPRESEQTTAYLAPFLAILVTAMVTGAFSAGFDWLYPIRVLAVLIVLWGFRKTYDLNWKWSWDSVLIGAAAFAIWLWFTPPGASAKDGWPDALKSIPAGWATAWLLIRTVGYVVTVPLAEELAFRGYLTRRLIQKEFHKPPVGMFTWFSFLVSSLLFGALHGQFWVAGTIAGLLFAVALYRRQRLGDAVLAHATTNALIAAYVFLTGRWSVWS